MIPLAIRGIIAAAGKTPLKKIKPSKIKELYMRGETLPYSAGIAGMQARVGGKKMFGPGIQGRDVTRNRATASTYAQGAMDSGVPIIRSKKITPTFREIGTDDPYGAAFFRFKDYPQMMKLDPGRARFPVDRGRSIMENIKSAMMYTSPMYKFAKSAGSRIPDSLPEYKKFYGLRDLLRKIKDPEQREILRKLFFGDISKLKQGGRV